MAVFLAAGGAYAQQKAKVIAIGTGGTGGVYYPLGGAVANVSVSRTADAAARSLSAANSNTKIRPTIPMILPTMLVLPTM